MIRSRVVALLVLGSLILAVAGQSAAQVRYVDDKGQSHWVQSEAQVPEQYKGKVATPSLPPVSDPNSGMTKRMDKFMREKKGKWAAQDQETAATENQAARVAASQATEQAKQQALAAWEQTVYGCIRVVQRGGGGFDAVINGPGRVQMLGTTEERFAFSKCMAESGQPMQFK